MVKIAGTSNVADTPNSASSSPKPSSKAKKAKKAGRRLTGVVNPNDLGDDDDEDDEDAVAAAIEAARAACRKVGRVNDSLSTWSGLWVAIRWLVRKSAGCRIEKVISTNFSGSYTAD